MDKEYERIKSKDWDIIFVESTIHERAIGFCDGSPYDQKMLKIKKLVSLEMNGAKRRYNKDVTKTDQKIAELKHGLWDPLPTLGRRIWNYSSLCSDLSMILIVSNATNKLVKPSSAL